MKHLTSKMKRDWFHLIEERDKGFCCFYCRNSLSLTRFVYDHSNDNRKDNRIENVVHACYTCNNKKKYNFDMQLLAKQKLEDNEIGKVLRSEMRENHFRHRGVIILIFNSKKEMLFQRRSMEKDVFPGYYGTGAGGVVSYGEDYDISAKREIEEELGIRAKFANMSVLGRS